MSSMSEERQDGAASTAQVTGLLSPVIRYLTRAKWPAWAVLLWNAFLFYPDWKSRIDVYVDTVRGMGGVLGHVAAAMTSPWFTPAATLAAILWILFLGEPRWGVVRHPRWAIVGWIAAGAFFTAIVVTIMWGAAELYIRSEIAKGIAGVPRGISPAENNPTKPQRPLQQLPRNLEPDQTRLLDKELPKLKPYAPVVNIASTVSDNESCSIARQYSNLLIRSGIKPDEFQLIPRGPEDQGLLILVPSVNNIPEAASKFQQALAIADISHRLSKVKKGYLKITQI